MKKSTIYAAQVVRDELLLNEQLANLITVDGVQKIFPLVAPKGTEGNYILYAKEGYHKEDNKANSIDVVTVNINAVSDDYDTSTEMLDLIRATVIRMRNKGMDVDITDMDEDTFGYDNSGISTFVQIVKIECKNF